MSGHLCSRRALLFQDSYVPRDRLPEEGCQLGPGIPARHFPTEIRYPRWPVRPGTIKRKIATKVRNDNGQPCTRSVDQLHRRKRKLERTGRERTLVRSRFSSCRKVWICWNIGREKEGRISALLTFWKWGRSNATPKTSYLVIFRSLSHNLLPAPGNTNIVAKGWSKSVLVLDLCLVALRSDHPIWMDSEQCFKARAATTTGVVILDFAVSKSDLLVFWSYSRWSVRMKFFFFFGRLKF